MFMFLLSFLIPFLSFEVVMYIEVILLAVIGYFYWQDYKEKEERLQYLEESERRRGESEKICGNCFYFSSARCERKETNSYAPICKWYLKRSDLNA